MPVLDSIVEIINLLYYYYEQLARTFKVLVNLWFSRVGWSPSPLFSKYSIIFEKFSILHNAQLVNKTNKRSQVSTKESSFSVVEIFNFPRSYQQNHWYPYNKLFLQLFQTFTNSQVMHSVHCHDFLAKFRVWPKSLMNTVPNHDHNYDLFFQINWI